MASQRPPSTIDTTAKQHTQINRRIYIYIITNRQPIAFVWQDEEDWEEAKYFLHFSFNQDE